VYTLDERLKGLPALKEQVVSLHQSLNQPHLAIPGRKAGPSIGYVLGLRGPSGFAVFVYLHLPDSGECAVYVPAAGTVAADKFEAEEANALSFVESMGFMMDNLNFRGRAPEDQDALLKTLSVFQREPRPKAVTPSGGGKPVTSPNQTLGKLFSAFCLSALGVSALGCAHVPSEREREQAQIRYELALAQAMTSPREAYREVEKSLELDPELADSWHVKGIILHTAFGRPEEAIAAYQKALKLRPQFSEAHTNLGNVYLDLKRYDEAIAEYETALNDVLYGAAFIAHGNMGWAYFRKGDNPQALDHLKAATTVNPKYCLGHVQLGQVLEQLGQGVDACKSYAKYRESCPEQADAYRREGTCQLQAGQKDLAKKSFELCTEKTTDDDQRNLCAKLKAQL
jgi:type IV pilus assembly protein PilF